MASVTVPQTGPRVASPRVVGGAIGTRRAGGGPATIGATGIIAEYPKAIRPGVSWLEFVDQDIQVELVVELFGYRFAGQGAHTLFLFSAFHGAFRVSGNNI